MDVVEMVIQMEKKEARMEGKLEERQEQKTLFVENLIKSTDFKDEKIAFLADVSPSFVAEVRVKLRSN